MSSISLLLYEYLMREQKLLLPSIGEISLHSLAPELNVEQGIFHPRRYQYVFKGESDEINLDKLENFVARKLGCKTAEASEVIHSWVDKVHIQCAHTKPYKWLDIGEFVQDNQQQLIFRPLREYFSFCQEVLFIRNMADVKKSNSNDYNSSSYTDERYELENNNEQVSTVEEAKENLPVEAAAQADLGVIDNELGTYATDDYSNYQTASPADFSAEQELPVEQNYFAVETKVADIPEKTSSRGQKVYTEFVELDAPERYGILHKVFVIILILAGFMYIFLHLFFNDFSFHSYVR